MQPGRARTSGLGVPLLPLARWVGWVAPVRLTHGVLVLSCPSAALRVCSVLGRLAPVHRCARAVCCVASAVSWATWLLSTVCSLGVFCCVCGVLGHLAPVHRCARWVCCVACVVSRATWLLFTGLPARCVALRVRFPGPLGSCSPVCPLGVLCCVCDVLGHLAPVHRCARSVCCCACAVSRATWLLFTGVPARCVVLRVLLLSPRPLPLSFSCSSLFAGSFCFVFFFFFGAGVAGVRRFGAVRGCGCVPVPVLVWARVLWGTGVGWLSRSGFPVCAPAPRLPVSRAPVRGMLTAGGWQQWWRGACVAGRGSWVVPGWRGLARACVWVCSWRGLMGWWAVWAWLVCVGVGHVCAEGAVGWAGALWAMQWVEEMLVTPTGGVL